MTDRHEAEVALRSAAVQFSEGLHTPVKDARDSAFARINRRLMKAAIRYAEQIKSEEPAS